MATNKIIINGKTVQSISIGNEVKDLTIEGSKYTFSNDIVITQDEVEKYTKDHTTWSKTPIHTISDSDYTSLTNKDGYTYNLNGYNGWTNAVQIWNATLITFKSNVELDWSAGAIALYNESNDSGKIIWVYGLKSTVKTSVKAGETWFIEKGKDPIKVTLPFDTSSLPLVATIDTTAKLKGLDVTYDYHENLSDGFHVNPTVKYDASVADTLNGGTIDVAFAKVALDNPARTVTEQDVKDYVDAHIDSSDKLDVTQWQDAGTTLYTPNLHIVKGTDYVYTVQAKDGFTINGGDKFEVTYNIPDTVIYVGTASDGIKKLVNNKLEDFDSASVVGGFMTQVADGTIYVGTWDSGIKKLVNDKLVDVDSTPVFGGFMTQVSDGTIYVGTWKNGMKKIESGSLVDFDSTNVWYGFMTQVADGTIYVGTNINGLKKLENGALIDVDSTDVSRGFMTQVSDGTIYVGTASDGIKKLVNDKLEDVDSIEVVGGFMYQVADGTIYIGVSTILSGSGTVISSGIKKLVNDKIEDVDSIDMSGGFMTQTSDGTIYVGTDRDGLKKLVNDKLEDVDNINVSGGLLKEVQV